MTDDGRRDVGQIEATSELFTAFRLNGKGKDATGEVSHEGDRRR